MVVKRVLRSDARDSRGGGWRVVHKKVHVHMYLTFT